MKYWIFFLLLPFSVIANAQVYQTEPLSDEIHTIQVLKNGDWQQSPVIEINSGDYIQLGFDRISEDSFNRLRYKIIHCNADWTQSSLSEIEYLDGFNDNLIEDYAASMNTTVEYTNFRLIIPNQDILRFKASGNYAVLVYEEDNRDNVMLSARFSVVDPQIVIAGNMSSNTLIDSNKSHQQISFILNHKGLNINDPYSDLKIFVRQNERQDNQKTDVKPTFIQPSRLVYEQNRDLIFPAGNEYRRFDMPSSRYNGLRIYHMEYNRPFYNAYVVPDKIRANTRYIYDEDQDGKFFIRNAEGSDSDTDADYFFVHFTLEAEYPFIENVYLNGRFTGDRFDNSYLMKYDHTREEYNLTLMLKQGIYNYQYLTSKGKGEYSTADVEGNYYETENEYQIYVYYRVPGARYDSLIGFLNIAR